MKDTPDPRGEDELRETLDLLATVMASLSDRVDAQGEALDKLAKRLRGDPPGGLPGAGAERHGARGRGPLEDHRRRPAAPAGGDAPRGPVRAAGAGDHGPADRGAPRGALGTGHPAHPVPPRARRRPTGPRSSRPCSWSSPWGAASPCPAPSPRRTGPWAAGSWAGTRSTA